MTRAVRVHQRPPQSRRIVTIVLLLGALASGCGSSADSSAGHVHGLGTNPANGDVYAATHTGIIRLGHDGPARVGDRVQDTMGFTVVGSDRFLASGHPGQADPGPDAAGLIRSDDGGVSWIPVSLGGQADFHALDAVDDTVDGWDSARGNVMRSVDSGRTWVRGAFFQAVGALAVDPDHADRVLATTASGLLQSVDGGATFMPATVQPPRPLVLVDHAPRSGGGGETALAGVDQAGTAWTFTGTTWSSGDEPIGPPQAFAVLAPDRYLVATDQGVLSTEDAGRTWTLIADLY